MRECAVKEVSIVVPCYNEEESIALFYEEARRVTAGIEGYAFTYLFVDDGSKDRSLAIIKELAAVDDHVKYISLSRNFGKEAAMFAGLEAAIGQYVAIMDVDLQDDPALLPRMLHALEEGYDCCGVRRVDRKGEPKIRSMFARLFYKIMNRFTEIELADGARDYRMMTRQMTDEVLRLREKERFIKGIFGWVGFRYYWLEYANIRRAAGETKWSFWKLLKYAVGGMMAFTTAPLKMLMWLGGAISIGSAVFMIVKIVKTLVWGIDVPGYASTVVLISFLGGINLFAIGLVGDYLGRVYTEVKNRPIYITRESNLDAARDQTDKTKDRKDC